MSNNNDLPEEFNRNPGASAQAICSAEEAVKVKLPNDYIAFLRASNGGEGMIGENYVILWNAEELAEMNKSYQVADYAPGLLLVGSDGGGEAFAFDTRTSPWPVVKVPFVGMELQYAEVIAGSFDEFLKAMAE
jgi:cell wall assembly regulator SMI1